MKEDNKNSIDEEILNKLNNTPCIKCRYSNPTLADCPYKHDLATAYFSNQPLPDKCRYKESVKVDQKGYTPHDHAYYRSLLCLPVEEAFFSEYEKYWSHNPVSYLYWSTVSALTVSEAIKLLLNEDPHNRLFKASDLHRDRYTELLIIAFRHAKSGKLQLIESNKISNVENMFVEFENCLVDMTTFYNWSVNITLEYLSKDNFLSCCIKKSNPTKSLSDKPEVSKNNDILKTSVCSESSVNKQKSQRRNAALVKNENSRLACDEAITLFQELQKKDSTITKTAAAIIIHKRMKSKIMVRGVLQTPSEKTIRSNYLKGL